MDQPRYRWYRPGYPLLARVLGLGRPAAIPWSLLAINLAAAVLGALALAT